MIIEISNNLIIISPTNEEVSPIVKSQLSFWNFDFNYSDNTFLAPLDKHLFLKIISYFENEELIFELKKDAKKYLENLEINNLNFEKLKAIAADYKSGNFNKMEFADFKDFVSQNIKRALKIHQLKAAYHLYLVGNGANFSVPGSGKTAVVLTVYEKLRIERKVNILFVVGPPSSFGPWKNEFCETLGRIPKFCIFAGGDKSIRKNQYYFTKGKKFELYLTTFQSLLYDQKELNDFLNQKDNNVFFVVDEAHYIKQINGNWARAILKQAGLAKFRCILTGTPMPKSYTDIFNLFDFLWPTQPPISQRNKVAIKYNEEIGNRYFVKNQLDENIGPLFYRVRKTDLKLMPQKFFKPDIIAMGKYEQSLYDAIYTRIKNFSQQEYFKNINFH